MLTDSHCHLDRLDLKNYDGDIKRAIASARLKGVEYILSPGVSIEEFPKILEIVNDDPNLFAAVGVHPTEEGVREPSLQELLLLGDNKKVVAIGETGFDFYYKSDQVTQNHQRGLFKLHIEAARELEKPLIIHSRNAEQDTIKLLVEENASKIGGVLHCFTGSLDMARKAVDLGFFISFSGIVTFPNANEIRSVAKNIPLENILIETDAPYLAPNPVRGKSNEPAYLPYIAEFMADLLGISYEVFINATTDNFLRFCKII